MVQLPDFLNGHIQQHLEPLINNSHGNKPLTNQGKCQLDQNWLNHLF